MVQLLESPPIPPEDPAVRAVLVDPTVIDEYPELFARAQEDEDYRSSPKPSSTATTVVMARMLFRAAREDPAAEAPQIQPDDGLGP